MRIGLVGKNSVEYIEQLFKIWDQGYSAVLLDWRMPMATMIERLEEAQVTQCIIEEDIFNRISTDFDLRGIGFNLYKVEQSLPMLLPAWLRLSFKYYPRQKEAIVVYSSGTTGKAKGIIHTHGTLIANAQMIMNYLALNEKDCMYMAKNIFHLSSIVGELLVSIMSGCQLLISNIVITPRQMVQQINRFAVTKMCLNPYLLKLIVDEQIKNPNTLNSAVEFFVYGEKASERLLKKAHAHIHNKIYCEYGLSEAGPRVSSQKIGVTDDCSVGFPLNEVHVIIMNEGQEAMPNTVGEIWVKTPSRFVGYVFGTKNHLDSIGEYIATGDLGYMNDYGELFIVGRIDDMINIHAHKIYPIDIEKIVSSTIELEECKVLDVLINDKQELCCAYIGQEIKNQSVRRMLKTKLIEYEIPKYYVRLDSFPLLPSGKLDRMTLKNKCEALLQNN